jgi:hypothetical protein
MDDPPPEKPPAFRMARTYRPRPGEGIDPREFEPETIAAVVSEWLAEKPAAKPPPPKPKAP